MSDPEKTTAVEKPPVFNRGRLLKIISLAVAAIAVTGIFFSSLSAKNTPAEEESQAAADVRAPDFSRQLQRARSQSSAEKDSPPASPSPSLLYEAPPPEDFSYSPPPDFPADRPAYPRESPPAGGGSPGGSRGGGRQKSPYQLARESSLVPEVQGTFKGGEASSSSPAAAEGSVSGSPPSPFPAPGLPPPAYPDLSALGSSLRGGAENSYAAQNMQGDKKSFYSSGAIGGKDITSGRFLEENTVWSGTIIPGVLITGINTDLPGDVQARVTQNIYDSLSGKRLLIPQGTILLAKYNSSVSFAQSRVQIAWNTLIRPDGFELDLGNMNAVDAEGFSGVEGEYSENLFQYAKAAGIISLFTILNGQINDSIGSSNSIRYQEMAAANQNVINQLGTSIIGRALDIQPTITVENGSEVKIMLNKNIMLPPAASRPVIAPYKRR